MIAYNTTIDFTYTTCGGGDTPTTATTTGHLAEFDEEDDDMLYLEIEDATYPVDVPFVVGAIYCPVGGKVGKAAGDGIARQPGMLACKKPSSGTYGFG